MGYSIKPGKLERIVGAGLTLTCLTSLAAGVYKGGVDAQGGDGDTYVLQAMALHGGMRGIAGGAVEKNPDGVLGSMFWRGAGGALIQAPALFGIGYGLGYLGSKVFF